MSNLHLVSNLNTKISLSLLSLLISRNSKYRRNEKDSKQLIFSQMSLVPSSSKVTPKKFGSRLILLSMTESHPITFPHLATFIQSSPSFCPQFCRTILLSAMKHQPEVINQPTAAPTQKTEEWFPASGDARGRRVISFYLAVQYPTKTIPLSSAPVTSRTKTRKDRMYIRRCWSDAWARSVSDPRPTGRSFLFRESKS